MTDVKATGEAPAAIAGPMAAVGFLLSQLGFVVSRRFHETLAPIGLEPRQFLVMRNVGLEEGRSQQALAEALNIPASRIVAIVDDLEERGILERRAHPTDRRARALYLTPEGRRVLGEAFRLATEFDAAVSKGLTPEEREQLLGLLRRLAATHNVATQVHAALTDDPRDCADPVASSHHR